MNTEINISSTKNGKVHLLAGGGKVFTDIASRVVRSERTAKEIFMSDYDAKIVDNILKSGHYAATEFDYYIFMVEGFSRITEVQLVRKRLASYLIKSGRVNLKGKRSFDVVLPESIHNHTTYTKLDNDRIFGKNPDGSFYPINSNELYIKNDIDLLLDLNVNWYESGVNDGYPEEDLRYIKPQATAFTGIVGMNAHALLDWFKIRTCQNAQHEIRNMANQMMGLCKDVHPDLFKYAGASCQSLGYCPEEKLMNPKCKQAGKYFTRSQAINILNDNIK